MLLFRPEHVAPILEGRKVQTRRTHLRGRAVGQVHVAKTKYQGRAFARLRITGIRYERLGDIDLYDVHREGYQTIEEYRGDFDSEHQARQFVRLRLRGLLNRTKHESMRIIQALEALKEGGSEAISLAWRRAE